MELAPAHMQPAQTSPVTAWLITAQQAAQILNVSKRTIQNLIRRGDLPTVQVADTAIRIWLEDLKAYAQKRTRRAYGSGKQV